VTFFDLHFDSSDSGVLVSPSQIDKKTHKNKLVASEMLREHFYV